MALPHLRPAQAVDVRPLGSRLASAKTVALFKSHELEVIRLVLLAGKSFPLHSVAGEVTIQCIEGKLEVATEGANRTLCAGQLLYLSAKVPHAVTAIEDASGLVTIVLHQ